MKTLYFTATLYIVSALAATLIYFYLLPQFIRDGGYLIILLLCLSLVLTGYIIERLIVYYQMLFRSGEKYLVTLFEHLKSADWLGLKLFLAGNPSLTSNIVMSALNTSEKETTKGSNTERKLLEITKSINDQLLIDQVRLEKNLPAISTIASISTMVGLLGTTFGMIKSFQALSQTGAPDAVQLSLGISEALINTAGGLIVAIIAIVAYNYFTSAIDRYTQLSVETGKRVSAHLLEIQN